MDFKTKTTEELRRLVADNKGKLKAFRFATAGSKTRNVKEGKNLRKEIARALTELKQKKA